MTEQDEARILEELEKYNFNYDTNVLDRLTPYELGELVTEIFRIKQNIVVSKGKNNVPTLDVPMARKNETVKGKLYYRFSAYFGTIHLLDTKGSVLCGKEIEGVNYARYKPFGTVCTICKGNIEP